MKTITINKPNHLLHGVTTEIVSIAPEGDRPVKINYFGEYFLTREEAGLSETKNPIKKMIDDSKVVIEAIKNGEKLSNIPGIDIVNPMVDNGEKVAKRAYKKRVEKPVTPKRKYTKRTK
jgi:hypothetical protein